MEQIPPLALSVRQPWAWAILQGGKDIENRTPGSIRAGRMVPGRICLHAAKGMREKEYRWAEWKMAQTGVRCPAPADLVRGAIIGTVEVVRIVTASDSPWFGGPSGLELRDPRAIDPIPAPGALGYFAWEAGGELVPPAPWMQRYSDDAGLFPELNLSFRHPPEKPWRR